MQSAAEAIRVPERLEEVRGRIEAAAGRADRDPKDIRIVAVTKSHTKEFVRAAQSAGLNLIGENRVEEALPKKAASVDLEGVEWHMIGHIQSRKARSVVEVFDAVHSVDRFKIADRLSQEAGRSGVRLPVLLECNVSGEASKWGWPLSDEDRWTEFVPEFSQICALPHIDVRGLMTMAPMVVEPELVRPVFRKLRALRGYLKSELPGYWDELSMGMTDDYEVAVEEGATLLRIGRAIFGPRTVG